MRDVRYRSSFKKDFRRIRKRGYDLALLSTVVELLRNGEVLPVSNRDHTLAGEWRGWRECHVEPDWLLIYRINADDEVLLARTGTHADLFE